MSSPENGCAGPLSFGFGNALSAAAAMRRSSRVVILMLSGEPATSVTAWPIRSTNWGVVGGWLISSTGVGVHDYLASKYLRGLRQPRALPVDGPPRRSIRLDWPA